MIINLKKGKKMMAKKKSNKCKFELKIFRRFFLSFFAIFILIVFSGIDVYSQEVVETELTPAQIKRQMIQAAKENINGTIWTIDLMRSGVAKAKGTQETDVLRFENYKVQSDKFKKEGFPQTNYTVRLKGRENEIVIWETMQTSKDKGIAFCRGEIRDGKMRGVISWHISEKKKQEYSFVSIEKDEVIKSSEEVIQQIKEEITPPAKEEVTPPIKEEVTQPVKEKITQPVKKEVEKKDKK